MCTVHDKTNNGEETDVVENTENFNDVLNSEQGTDKMVDEPLEEVEDNDEGEIAMAEELERFAKLAETVSFMGSKCQDCSTGKQVIAHKDNIIGIQESKIKATQSRLMKSGKEKSLLVKEKKEIIASVNKLKQELINSPNSHKLDQETW